ncbi:MAG: adenylate/guanylate cyclase domain-containing protein [Pseudanabaenales cyanobacterium]|nr:adenylate/guanylate cyclase domain-containing protein [Pseudanabaenales cyanobacterium]
MEASAQKLTVVCTDLKSFLQFNQQLSDRQLAEFLDTYYCDAGEVIRDFGGTVDKFMGDSVLALFNAPEPIREPEQRAVSAANSLKQRLAKRWPKLHMSVGVATGEAIVGYFGPSFCQTYTALGPTVNRAFVLEKRSHQTGFKILVDSATHECLNGRFEVRRHLSSDHPFLAGEAVYEIS